MNIIEDLRHLNVGTRHKKIRNSQYFFLNLSDLEFKKQFRFSKMNVRRLSKLLGEIAYYLIFYFSFCPLSVTLLNIFSCKSYI